MFRKQNTNIQFVYSVSGTDIVAHLGVLQIWTLGLVGKVFSNGRARNFVAELCRRSSMEGSR